jgi:FAD synthetase
MKKVLVGGTFAMVHPGHMFFLKKARSLGNCLVVVVAHEKTVLESKGKRVSPAAERAKALRKLDVVDRVRLGRASNKLKIAEEEKPDIIALGFDQEADEKDLRKELRKRGLECRVVRIKASLPGYSTSMIKK